MTFPGQLGPLVVEPADEPDLVEQIRRRVGGEVEDGVFLSNLGSQHFRSRFLKVEKAFLRRGPAGTTQGHLKKVRNYSASGPPA